MVARNYCRDPLLPFLAVSLTAFPAVHSSGKLLHHKADQCYRATTTNLRVVFHDARIKRLDRMSESVTESDWIKKIRL